MNVKKLAKLLVYRCAEKGFEILIIPEKDPETGEMRYKFPKGLADEIRFIKNLEKKIQLHYSNPDHPERVKSAIAVEGDYKDLKPLTEEITNDIKYVKEKLGEVIPEIGKGSFVSLKEAFKQILPYEYELLKELKEIISDRNQLQNI